MQINRTSAVPVKIRGRPGRVEGGGHHLGLVILVCIPIRYCFHWARCVLCTTRRTESNDTAPSGGREVSQPSVGQIGVAHAVSGGWALTQGQGAPVAAEIGFTLPKAKSSVARTIVGNIAAPLDGLGVVRVDLSRKLYSEPGGVAVAGTTSSVEPPKKRRART